MKFDKISAPTLKDLFVQQLEHMILSGKLEIGTKLPPERELAQSMQVSRAVVNAGINEMATKGFVDIQPRIGTFVADYRRYGTMETMLSLMKYNGGNLRRDEVRSLLEMKLVLDRLAVELAIPRLADTDMTSLQALLRSLDEAQTPDLAANAAFVFYQELALLSGNTLLPLIYHSFKVPVLSLWARFGRKYGVGSLQENARQLLFAIEQGDTVMAVQCIEQVLGNAIKGSQEIYSE